MRPSSLSVPLAVALAALAIAPAAHAHGLIGKRFLPATLAVDDPFVADELSLPTVEQVKRPGEDERPPTRETTVSAEISKRLTPDLGLSLGGAWKRLDPDDATSVTGFDNLEVALKYVFFRSPAHELLLSAGLAWDVGGTGSRKIDAERFDTLTPQLFLGKGFGDLPAAAEWLRPLAVTGVFGVAIPSQRNTRRIHAAEDDDGTAVDREFHPHVAQWGGTVQYSLPYLQSFVRDVGLPRPLSRLIPIVEFSMETPLQGPAAGRTTGTINPGIVWVGRYVQLGLEAVLPVNERTGRTVGVLGQLHVYLDDLLPKVFTWTPFHGPLAPAVPR